MTNRNLELLARLLEYPGADYAGLVEQCCEGILGDSKEAYKEAMGANLTVFRDAIRPFRIEDLEDLYTRTFDLNPVCSLDVGWHLYAENYDRGTFLVKMREALRQYGIQETTELPDHLPSMLNLIARMPAEEQTELIESSIVPALEKMLEGFRDSENPYRFVIGAVATTLREIVHQQPGVPSHG